MKDYSAYLHILKRSDIEKNRGAVYKLGSRLHKCRSTLQFRSHQFKLDSRRVILYFSISKYVADILKTQKEMTSTNPQNTTKKRKQLSDAERGEIIEKYKSGHRMSKISKEMKIPNSTVQGVLDLYKLHGIIVPKKRIGRGKMLSDRARSAMARAICASPSMTVSAQHAFFTAGGIDCSLSTFRRSIKDMGFCSYVSKDKLVEKINQGHT